MGEYYALLLGAALGASLLASANNLILFAVALETLSLCCYILAGYHKHQRHSAEASLKLHALRSCVLGSNAFWLKLSLRTHWKLGD